MPDDVIASSDRDWFAGEYVLGTLDAQERTAAQQLIARDADFAAKVKVWERRLGELHLMVEPIEPEAKVWARIKAGLPEPGPFPESAPEPESQQQGAQAAKPKSEPSLPELNLDFDLAPKPMAQPQLPPAPTLAPEPAPHAAAPAAEQRSVSSKGSETSAVDVIASARSEPTVALQKETPPTPPLRHSAEPAETAAPHSLGAAKPRSTAASPEIEHKVRSLRRHLAGWRAFATIMALALIALAGLIAVWRYAPERLPPQLRPVALMRLAGIRVEGAGAPRKPLPPESQFDE